MAKRKTEFRVENITAAHVLGMMVRKSQGKGIPPCLLCMSDSARAEIQSLGVELLEKYRQSEANMKTMREAGNVRAFFVQ